MREAFKIINIYSIPHISKKKKVKLSPTESIRLKGFTAQNPFLDGYFAPSFRVYGHTLQSTFSAILNFFWCISP